MAKRPTQKVFSQPTLGVNARLNKMLRPSRPRKKPQPARSEQRRPPAPPQRKQLLQRQPSKVQNKHRQNLPSKPGLRGQMLSYSSRTPRFTVNRHNRPKPSVQNKQRPNVRNQQRPGVQNHPRPNVQNKHRPSEHKQPKPIGQTQPRPSQQTKPKPNKESKPRPSPPTHVRPPAQPQPPRRGQPGKYVLPPAQQQPPRSAQPGKPVLPSTQPTQYTRQQQLILGLHQSLTKLVQQQAQQLGPQLVKQPAQQPIPQPVKQSTQQLAPQLVEQEAQGQATLHDSQDAAQQNTLHHQVSQSKESGHPQVLEPSSRILPEKPDSVQSQTSWRPVSRPSSSIVTTSPLTLSTAEQAKSETGGSSAPQDPMNTFTATQLKLNRDNIPSPAQHLDGGLPNFPLEFHRNKNNVDHEFGRRCSGTFVSSCYEELLDNKIGKLQREMKRLEAQYWGDKV